MPTFSMQLVRSMGYLDYEKKIEKEKFAIHRLMQLSARLWLKQHQKKARYGEKTYRSWQTDFQRVVVIRVMVRADYGSKQIMPYICEAC
jgi:hypothetical protein